MNAAAQPGLPQLAAAIQQTFEAIHERAFRGDPAANPRLHVRVVAAAMAHDTPVAVVLTPWTCNGLAFPPDAQFADEVDIGGKRLPARTTRLPELGQLWSVNLIPDVSRLTSQDRAEALARGWAGPWADAVARVRSCRS
jgi:hypothetical protein